MSANMQRYFALLVLQAFSMLLSSRVDPDLAKEWRRDVDFFRQALDVERQHDNKIKP